MVKLSDFFVYSIKDEWKEVRKKFKFLGELKSVDEGFEAEDKIEIIDPSGILWRPFDVRIKISSKYPKIPPIIFETGKEIPKEPDWHINRDGSCCVGPNAKIFRKLDNKISIIGWLENIVMPFFFDQVHKLENGEYRGKEYSHGSYGLIEDYKEWWNLESEEEVIVKLKLITNWVKYPRNEKCFCGSELKFKKCHLTKSTYKGIPKEVLNEDLRMIQLEMLQLRR